MRRLNERAHGGGVGDGRGAGGDVKLGRALEPNGAGRDYQVADIDLSLERAGRPDADEGWALRYGEQLRHNDLNVVRADAGRDTRHTRALVHPGRRRELAVA